MKKWKLAIIILLCIVLLVALWLFIIPPKLSWLSGEMLAIRLTWLGCDFSDTEHDDDFYVKLRGTVIHFEHDPDSTGLNGGYILSHKHQQMIREAVRKYYNIKPDPVE